MATPSTRPPFVPTPSTPTRVEGEPSASYAARVLAHAIQHPDTLYRLDVETLEHIDAAARLCVVGLPADLEEAGPTFAGYARRLADLRHLIERRRQQHRRGLAWLAQQLGDAPPDDAPDAPPPAGPPESETDRAARLLRAGLIALMDPHDPQQGSGGGRPAPLVPPSNPRPTDTRRRF